MQMAVTLGPIPAETPSRPASNPSSQSPTKFVSEGAIGGHYGFSLWARKPIAEHVAANETQKTINTHHFECVRFVK